MRIINATALLGGKWVPDSSLLTAGGKIVTDGSTADASENQTLDLGGDFLLPGFVDVHIHAFMGMDVMGGENAVRHMSRELIKCGVAAFLPTTMSATPEATQSALAGIKAVMDRPEPNGALVLGAHMEAPFMQASKAGAQRPEFFALPTVENWHRYVGNDEDIVRLITLAPDLPDAMPFIRYLTQRNITVSIGHTDATAETVHEAAENGAAHVTHTFNAQSPLSHRAPGVPGASLVDDRLFCELICDGVHLHPDIVRLAVRCKGANRALAVTDAMEATGMPDGKYQLGGLDVFVQDGAARLADGTLAGSTLTLVRALQNLISFGIASEDAAAMVTKTPALSIGNRILGDLTVQGAPAVFTRFTKDWQFAGTITG